MSRVQIPVDVDLLERIETATGYRFRNPAILAEALDLHYWRGSEGKHLSNRYATVGSSAVQMAVTNALYRLFPELEPHDLTHRRQLLFESGHMLNIPAVNAVLDRLPPERKKLCSDKRCANGVFNAIIGAIHVDSGMDNKVIHQAALQGLRLVNKQAVLDFFKTPSEALSDYVNDQKIEPPTIELATNEKKRTSSMVLHDGTSFTYTTTRHEPSNVALNVLALQAIKHLAPEIMENHPYWVPVFGQGRMTGKA